MKDIHRQLGLDDAIDGNLVDVDTQPADVDQSVGTEVYCWNVGYRQYIKRF